MAEGFLRNVLIIDLNRALDGLGQRLGGVETGGGQDLSEAPIEALDHPIGLRGAWLDEAMFDRVGRTDPIEAMAPGGFTLTGGTEAVGELFAIIGQDFGDREGRLGDQALQESGGIVSGFLREDLDIHPARGPIDGGKQILSAVLVRHSGQVLHIDMDNARLVVLEGLDWARA